MHYTFASRTDPGRVRANNEDAVLVDEARGLAVLADGMGGHNAGEVAAAMAVAGIGTSMGRWLDAQRLDGPVPAGSGAGAGTSGHEAHGGHAAPRLPAVAVMQAMAALLQLPELRLSRRDWRSWMDVPACRRRYGLELAQVDELDAWLAQANVRWGLDTPHRADFGLPSTLPDAQNNTWLFGLERLLLGSSLHHASTNQSWFSKRRQKRYASCPRFEPQQQLPKQRWQPKLPSSSSFS